MKKILFILSIMFYSNVSANPLDDLNKATKEYADCLNKTGNRCFVEKKAMDAAGEPAMHYMMLTDEEKRQYDEKAKKK